MRWTFSAALEARLRAAALEEADRQAAKRTKILAAASAARARVAAAATFSMDIVLEIVHEAARLGAERLEASIDNERLAAEAEEKRRGEAAAVAVTRKRAAEARRAAEAEALPRRCVRWCARGRSIAVRGGLQLEADSLPQQCPYQCVLLCFVAEGEDSGAQRGRNHRRYECCCGGTYRFFWMRLYLPRPQLCRATS